MTEEYGPAPPSPCVCGQTMTRVTWQELRLGGGTRDVTGFACSTDGCEGNFPQRWGVMIEETHGEAEAR